MGFWAWISGFCQAWPPPSGQIHLGRAGSAGGHSAWVRPACWVSCRMFYGFYAAMGALMPLLEKR